MRIGHEQMAHYPCRFGPFLLVAADAEQVHELVQVGLEVALLHPGEAEEVAPKPRAQVVHELHRLQVRRILRIRLTPRRCTWRPSRGFCGPSPCRGR